jgi:transglutaminase-like putative cysteine protease
MPAWAARLAGFAALATLGALEWQRMVAGLGSKHAFGWVAVALLTAVAVLACERLPERSGTLALAATAIGGLVAAYLITGLELRLLAPKHLSELFDGLSGGAQALGGVTLPYAGADTWPRAVLELLGAELCVLAALLAFWPRGDTRGYPFFALAVLLVLAIAPVVSIGGPQTLLLGALLATLTVCFLWLERLPLRPGIGVAALLAIALAGALPFAAWADRDEPWFDYQTFAEGIGPDDPIRFDFEHGDYGPVTWPRDGAEVLRVKAQRAAYWKVLTLEDFDGFGWEQARIGRSEVETDDDLPSSYRSQLPFEAALSVAVRRFRGSDVVGAGTILEVTDSTRGLAVRGDAGRWITDGDLRSGDSYRVRAYVPRPSPSQLNTVRRVSPASQQDALRLRVPLLESAGAREGRFRPGDAPAIDIGPDGLPRTPFSSELPGSATIHFAAFGSRDGEPTAEYQRLGLWGPGDPALRVSAYARTWRLAQRLRAQASTPYEYVVAVSQYLQDFEYSENPAPPPAGEAPLETFLFRNKAGYCQHFSAAMAMLLRMGGVPARVATGFSPGGFSKRRGAWIVRDTDAHSWVEAWFDGFGWVTLDPTPAATPARSLVAAIQPPPSAANAPGAGAAPEAADPAGGGNGPADRRAAGEREQLFERLRQTSPDVLAEDDGGAGGAPWLRILAGVVAVLLLAGLTVRFVRRRRRRPATRLDAAIWELEEALRRAGRPAPTGTTLRQLEQRLGGTPEATAYLRALSAARYAPAPQSPTRKQRRALRRALAQGLGPAGRLRALWALPPQLR